MRFQPHPYQRYCIDRLIQDPFVGLMLDMGLGKTVITLTAIWELKLNRWQVCRPLIIAPKKVAEATWQAEASRWDHLKGLRFSTVLGGEQKRIRALATPADVYITSRDNVAWLVDYYRNTWPFDMVVLDESSSFKNAQSKRFKSLRLVRPRIRRLVELTGTPAPNGLEDMWAQVYLLDEGARLGRTISSFREQFFTQDPSHPGQQYRTYTPQEGAQKRLQAAINDICISMKAEDYLGLPEIVVDDIPVALDPQAAKAYKKLERDLLLEVDQQTITAGTAAVLNGKLLQLCSGTVYDTEGRATAIHGCKLEALAETVEQMCGEHVLVFYWFQHEPDRIRETLQRPGRRIRLYKGQEDAAAWNAGEVDVLLAHPASCGYGLNLQQGGHHVIWYSLPNWTLELYQQANKRLHRQGQQYPVIIHRLLVSGGIDEDMAASLEGKGDTQEAMMQALKARIELAKS